MGRILGSTRLGLGHSTVHPDHPAADRTRRSCPIIGADNGPWRCCSKSSPTWSTFGIPGMTIRYAKGESQLWSMARQFPEMMRSVRAETAALRSHPERPAARRGDQRPAIRTLRSSTVPSVRDHASSVPVHTHCARRAAQVEPVRHLSRFDRCWIMDEPEAPGLAGNFRMARSLPANTRYIGTVSRMTPGTDQPLRKEALRTGSWP
jgi:hypothetical protein